MAYLLAYALLGLAGIFVLLRRVGFRETDEIGKIPQGLIKTGAGFAELVLQSFVAAYVVLLLFGIVEVNNSITTVVRMGLIQMVPLGFGAAVAIQLLSESDGEIQVAPFPKSLPTFAMGAVFFTPGRAHPRDRGGRNQCEIGAAGRRGSPFGDGRPPRAPRTGVSRPGQPYREALRTCSIWNGVRRLCRRRRRLGRVPRCIG